MAQVSDRVRARKPCAVCPLEYKHPQTIVYTGKKEWKGHQDSVMCWPRLGLGVITHDTCFNCSLPAGDARQLPRLRAGDGLGFICEAVWMGLQRSNAWPFGGVFFAPRHSPVRWQPAGHVHLGSISGGARLAFRPRPAPRARPDGRLKPARKVTDWDQDAQVKWAALRGSSITLLEPREQHVN